MPRSPYLILLLILVRGCETQTNHDGPQKETKADALERPLRGPYQAILRPITQRFAPQFNGSFTLVREADDLVAGLRYSAGVPDTLVIQGLHRGSRCPDLQRDDSNGDGHIDGPEGAAVYGPTLIPLDDDLSAQHLGGGIYPVSDTYGQYYWFRTAVFSRLLRDLREEDLNPLDDLVKLSPRETITDAPLVVVVSGVPAQAPLPESVLGKGSTSPQGAYPVACGVLLRSERVPGKILPDETQIPVPDAGGVGGSGGVDDGADFPEPTTSSGGSGNYGE